MSSALFIPADRDPGFGDGAGVENRTLLGLETDIRVSGFNR